MIGSCPLIGPLLSEARYREQEGRKQGGRKQGGRDHLLAESALEGLGERADHCRTIRRHQPRTFDHTWVLRRVRVREGVDRVIGQM